jgi:hypothetical protein
MPKADVSPARAGTKTSSSRIFKKCATKCLGIRDSGCEIRVSGAGIRVWSFGMRDSEFEFQDSGFGIRDSDFRIRSSGFGIRDPSFWIRDSGFGIRDSGFYRITIPVQKLSCNEVYCTNACILLVKIMLCSKLCCQNFFNLKLFS